jgi:hypothetical protein
MTYRNFPKHSTDQFGPAYETLEAAIDAAIAYTCAESLAKMYFDVDICEYDDEGYVEQVWHRGDLTINFRVPSRQQKSILALRFLKAATVPDVAEDEC